MAMAWRRGLITRVLGYWSATTPDGRFCFVANSLTNNVSVISYRRAKEVATVRVGNFPQRIRAASLSRDVLGP